ncbi:MAG: hypothetical protein RLZZ127_2778 [Planctomycetota bacterium]|jgi:hypothetical protein
MLLRPAAFLLAISCATAVPAVDAPWSETFVMEVKGKDCRFVVHKGSSWLEVTLPEAAAGDLATDIMLPAKIRGTPARAGRATIYGLEQVELVGAADLWSGFLEDDNIYLLASAEPGPPYRLRVRAVLPAPGDREVITARLAQAQAGDWDARLAACRWIRTTAAVQGNRDFWLNQADIATLQLVREAAEAAARAGDGALLERAVGWCFEDLRDPGRAAETASAPWLAGPAAERIGQRMRGLGFALYRDRWYPRAEALTREFDDRWAAIAPDDAEGYYRLGRWADSQAEVLPRSKDYSFRCFQAGYRADPDHTGLRRELGLAPVAAGSRRPGAAVAAETRPGAWDPSGLRVPAPNDWSSVTVGSATTFTSALHPGAAITVTFASSDPGLDGAMARIRADSDGLPGLQVLEEGAFPFALGEARRLRYSTTAGDGVVIAQTVLLRIEGAAPLVRLQIAEGGDPAAIQGVVDALVASVHLGTPGGAP